MEGLSIGDIKRILNSTDITEIPSTIEKFKNDSRAGVKSLISAFDKKYKCYLDELERIKTISEYENYLYNKGVIYVAGIDEVGRGPLAGPVVTAIVILKKDCSILGINDSKKLSQSKREELYEKICEESIDYSVGIVSPEEIDEINILQATYKAMRKAIDGLKIKPNHILVDALTIPEVDLPQTGIIKGDEKSISIGAASIIAKVTRDRMMVEYDKVYPGYGFADNKGYGSAKHIEAIKKQGICPLHRKSFVKNFV